MPRKVKPAKPLIYVFCEGESEQAYTDYLKKTFSDVAVLKRPPDTGLFEEAEAKFSKSPKYKNSIEVTDEISALINSLVTNVAFSLVYVLIAPTNSFTAILNVSFSALDATCDKYTS